MNEKLTNLQVELLSYVELYHEDLSESDRLKLMKLTQYYFESMMKDMPLKSNMSSLGIQTTRIRIYRMADKLALKEFKTGDHLYDFLASDYINELLNFVKYSCERASTHPTRAELDTMYSSHKFKLGLKKLEDKHRMISYDRPIDWFGDSNDWYALLLPGNKFNPKESI